MFSGLPRGRRTKDFGPIGSGLSIIAGLFALLFMFIAVKQCTSQADQVLPTWYLIRSAKGHAPISLFDGADSLLGNQYAFYGVDGDYYLEVHGSDGGLKETQQLAHSTSDGSTCFVETKSDGPITKYVLREADMDVVIGGKLHGQARLRK